MTVSTAFGGMEKHTLELATVLRARGHDVTIVQLGHDFYAQAGRERGLEVTRVDLGTTVPRAAFRRLKDALRRWRGAIGIFPKGWFPDGSATFDLAARLTFRRYVTIEHLRAEPLPAKMRGGHLGGIVPGLGLWWYRMRVTGWLRGRLPHRTVCVSESVRKGLLETHGFRPDRTFTVLNGVDTDVNVFREEQRASYRAALGVPDDAVLFGFVGRVSPVKNVEVAVRAFATLRQSARERAARLLIVGEGPSMRSVEEVARTSGAADRIHFRGFTERPWEVYSALDVLVLPSLNEGLPLTVLEAMACRCAVIATDVGGVPEVVHDAVGWLVPPGDDAAFAAAMRKAAALDAGALRDMGVRGRAQVLAKFNAATQLAVLAELLEREGQAA